jgi:Zn-dependent peptidase ImmA (M78 family)
MDITSIPKEVLDDPNKAFLVDEQIANIFSLLVLMPQDAFIRALKNYDKISDIAKLFGVEPDAVKSRMLLLVE